MISKYANEISNENSLLVYNSKLGNSVLLRDDSIKIYKMLKNGMSFEEIKNEVNCDAADALFDSLTENYIVESEASMNKYNNISFTDDHIDNGALLRHLRLNVTERCNLDCSYCFERASNIYSNKRIMTFPVAKLAIDSFMKVIKDNAQKNISIRFFGGEPMLNWTLVDECLDYVSSLDLSDIKVDFIINTNGTLLNDEMTEKCSERKINISLSLDGVGEFHDLTRMYENGRGSFSVIDKNIDLLIKNNCTFNISCVCSDINIEKLPLLLDYIKQKNTKFNTNISANFNFIQIRGGDKINTLSVMDKIKYLVAAINYADNIGVSCFGGLSHFTFSKLLFGNVGSFCGGAGGEVSVSPNGEVCPCSAQDVILGSVNDLRACFQHEYYRKIISPKDRMKKCDGCEIEGFCGGGCLAEIVENKEFFERPAEDCFLQKELFKALVQKYILDLNMEGD